MLIYVVRVLKIIVKQNYSGLSFTFERLSRCVHYRVKLYRDILRVNGIADSSSTFTHIYFTDTLTTHDCPDVSEIIMVIYISWNVLNNTNRNSIK